MDNQLQSTAFEKFISLLKKLGGGDKIEEMEIEELEGGKNDSKPVPTIISNVPLNKRYIIVSAPQENNTDVNEERDIQIGGGKKLADKEPESRSLTWEFKDREGDNESLPEEEEKAEEEEEEKPKEEENLDIQGRLFKIVDVSSGYIPLF